MKAIITAIAVVVLTLTASYAAGPPPTVSASGNIVVMSSQDQPGSVSPDSLDACALHLAEEMKLAGKEMPHIAILRISQPAAQAMGLKESTVRRVGHLPAPPAGGTVLPVSSGELGPRTQVYYELWLIAPSGNGAYAAGIQRVLEAQFQLDVAQDERQRILAHVVEGMDPAANTKALGQ